MDFFKSRKKIYSSIKKTVPSIDKDIFFSWKLDNKDEKKLKTAALNIIKHNFEIVYKKKFLIKDNFINKNINKIVNLPNITPNGLVQPRKELAKKFNILHKKILSILIKKKLINKFDCLMAPVLRIKVPPKKKVLKRVYSTYKVHSDAWNGVNLNSIIMFGIFGNFEKNTVKYYICKKYNQNILKVMKNFNEGKKYYSNLSQIGIMTKSKLFLIDQACLHRTYIDPKYKKNIRISIDVVANPKNSKFLNKNLKKYPSFKINAWKKLNYSKLIPAKYSIFSKDYI